MTGNCQSEISATNLLTVCRLVARASFIVLHAEQSASRSVQITMVDTPSACLLNPKREIGQLQREHRDNESNLFCRSFTLRTRSFRKSAWTCEHTHTHTKHRVPACVCVCVRAARRDREEKREESLFNIYLLRLELVNRESESERSK